MRKVSQILQGKEARVCTVPQEAPVLEVLYVILDPRVRYGTT